jgi:ABC-2 type transport system ATP-binding protein
MRPLETNGLSKYYGEVRGIEDLTFAAEAGEVFGFLGPNGAGKTTTIRTLMGFQSPTAGTATVLGADITDTAALRGARANVGYLPSESGFNENVTGRRLLEYHGSLRATCEATRCLHCSIRHWSAGSGRTPVATSRCSPSFWRSCTTRTCSSWTNRLRG